MRFTLLQRPVTAINSLLTRRQQIRYRAFHDELTGLPNRYLFRDRLEQALARAQRHPPGFAVVYVDVDGFKAVNDGYGHWMGDELLRHIGSCLSAGLRAADTAARLGGDEFALLLQDVDDAHTVRAAIQRVEEALHRPVRIDGRRLDVSCSVGFSLYPHDGVDASMLLRHADMAMYTHKNDALRRVSRRGADSRMPATGRCG
jgi:diguanylate cyclase (GGDEF)-like protein